MYLKIAYEKKQIFLLSFVRYATSQELLKAVKELNGWPMRGQKIVVDISKDSIERMEKLKGKHSYFKKEAICTFFFALYYRYQSKLFQKNLAFVRFII